MKNESFTRFEKVFIKFMSLFIAVTLWMLISYIMNPEFTKNFRNVEIEYLYPKSASLVLLNEHPADLDIELRGRRNDIISLQKKDIKVYVDLRRADLGLQLVDVEVHTPSKKNFTVLSKEFERVELDIDRTVNKSFYINLRKKPYADEDKWLKLRLNPEFVVISGPESYVKQIRSLYVDCDFEALEKTHQKSFDERGSSVGKIKLPIKMEPETDSEERFTDEIVLESKEVTVDASIMRNKVLEIKYDAPKLKKDHLMIASQKLSHQSLKFEGLETEIATLSEAFCKVEALEEIAEPGTYKLKLKFRLPSSVRPIEETEVYLILEVKEKEDA